MYSYPVSSFRRLLYCIGDVADNIYAPLLKRVFLEEFKDVLFGIETRSILIPRRNPLRAKSESSPFCSVVELLPNAIK